VLELRELIIKLQKPSQVFNTQKKLKVQQKYFFYYKKNKKTQPSYFIFLLNFFRIYFSNFIIIQKKQFIPLTYLSLFLKKFNYFILYIYKTVCGEGFFYLRGLLIIFFVDASLTDDEPL
jgi:hypothetical protein